MPPRIIIRRVLLPANQQLGVKQTPIIPRSDLINWTRIQIHEDRSRDIFSASGLCEDGVEFAGVVERGSVGVGATVLFEAVFEEVAGEGGSVTGGVNGGMYGGKYSSQALLPSWVPAWPM